jgi:hypothetical protein
MRKIIEPIWSDPAVGASIPEGNTEPSIPLRGARRAWRRERPYSLDHAEARTTQ